MGTGKASTWNELAGALFAAVGKKPSLNMSKCRRAWKSVTSYFTQADMAQVRKSGYTKPFTPLKESVADYVHYLKDPSLLVKCSAGWVSLPLLLLAAAYEAQTKEKRRIEEILRPSVAGKGREDKTTKNNA